MVFAQGPMLAMSCRLRAPDLMAISGSQIDQSPLVIGESCQHRLALLHGSQNALLSLQELVCREITTAE